MLWYKGWLEIRIRLLLAISVMCWTIYMAHTMPLAAGKVPVPSAGTLVFANRIVLMVSCLWVAGAGIMTQASFQAMKGLHGSTLFTVSLPVSRLRLLAVRASLGWFAMAGLIGILCCGIWTVSPALRTMVTPVEMFEYGGTLFVCTSAFYFFCVVLSTFLEDPWRIVVGMISFVSFRWVFQRAEFPVFANIYEASGKYSPLMAHAIPWNTMALAFGLSALLFVVALKIVQAREY